MKKILFALHYMNVGGVEKAFLGMLDTLPHDDLEVHVAFFAPEGGFMGYIPSWVHVHGIAPFYNNRAFLNNPVKTTINSLLRGRAEVLRMLPAFIKSKIAGDKEAICRYLLRDDNALGTEFDLAVSYASPHEYLDYYISHHIKAKRRAAWIHFDVSKCFNSQRSINRAFSNIERIFVVSDKGREIFNQKYPALATKTATFHNIISPSNILRDAKRPSSYRASKECLNIVTVGRLNHEKGQHLAVAALAQLRARGIHAMLHLVGNGRTADTCRRIAMEAGIDDYVRFYGSQANPYPYMAGADIYLQPSLHEGYCITLAEAKIFEAPIVATDFTGAREQLSARPNAVIADDFTPEALADALEKAAAMPRCEGCREFTNDMPEFLKLLQGL